MTQVRLNKYLAEQGVASRREADRLILDGLISVNGKVIKEMGVKIDPKKDKVSVSDEVIERRKKLVYLALNKPPNYVTSVKRNKIEPKIVMDLIKTEERVYPVGRLDKGTTGLLIFTNDGTLTYKLTHPSSRCEKEYEVIVAGVIRAGAIEKLEKGVKLWGERTQPVKIKKINPHKMSITITEGKNRQIRRICQKVGLPVDRLKRVRIKNLKLGGLLEGKTRPLTPEEVKGLKA